jgi:Uma2 family endonuclease
MMDDRIAPELELTIEEFLALTESRPDGERWELIEGKAIMNPSPSQWHQVITGNIFMALGQIKLRTGAAWIPALGVGTRVPIDAMVFAGPATDSPVSENAIVLVEVLSKSNTKKDQAWRRKVYASVPNCEHYVALAQGKVEAVGYDRSADWTGAKITGLDSVLELPALGLEAAIPMREHYRWTPLAG